METTILTPNPKENNDSLTRLANSPYTIAEAATVLRMSDKSVRRQIDRGHLRKCKVFGRVLIPRKDVDTFIEKFSAYSFAQ
jgi:excisionase family DNA binding protein